MPFTLMGHGEAAPGTGTPNLAGAAKETLFKVSGDKTQLNEGHGFLLGLAAYAESTGGYILVRQSGLDLDYRFIKCALLGVHEPAQAFIDLMGRPLPLITRQWLEVLINNATDEDAIVYLYLGNGKITQAALDNVNPTHSLRGISDTTLTAFTWTTASITWDEDLPKGTYSPVGMRYAYYKSSAAMPCAARLIIPKSMWRPGVVGSEAQADKLEVQEHHLHPFSKWPLMPEITFEHDNPPDIEVLGAEASTDHLIELLVQKVG